MRRLVLALLAFTITRVILGFINSQAVNQTKWWKSRHADWNWRSLPLCNCHSDGVTRISRAIWQT